MTGRGFQPIDPTRREAERSALALAAADVGEHEWDVVRDEWFVSVRLASLTGLTPGARPARDGEALYDHVHPGDVDTLRGEVGEGLRLRDRYDARFRFIRPDNGRLMWLQGAALAVRGDHGQLLQTVGVVRDISADKGEADHREALLAELDHRIKNVLASVQSLAAQSARRTVSIEAFLETFFGRLDAMAAAHTLLTATRWRGAELGHIAAAELGGLAPGQARWEGPDLLLNPRATHALTLALHELSANAVKYGALSTDTGRVDVNWRVSAKGGFQLVWTETGGPIVAPPARRGFGSTLLERVTGKEIDGAVGLDFRPEGLQATLTAGPAALASETHPERVMPLSAGQSPTRTEPQGGASRGGGTEADISGLRVLIVEDAVLLALELESGLSGCGAEVVGSAADLDEGRRLLSLEFDVAILDVNLNGKSVAPLAESLAGRGIPFIFATGYGAAGAAPEGFSAPVVRKPYNIRQIATALAAATGRV